MGIREGAGGVLVAFLELFGELFFDQARRFPGA